MAADAYKKFLGSCIAQRSAYSLRSGLSNTIHWCPAMSQKCCGVAFTPLFYYWFSHHSSFAQIWRLTFQQNTSEASENKIKKNGGTRQPYNFLPYATSFSANEMAKTPKKMFKIHGWVEAWARIQVSLQLDTSSQGMLKRLENSATASL